MHPKWEGVTTFTLTEAQLCAFGLEHFLTTEVKKHLKGMEKTTNSTTRQKSAAKRKGKKCADKREQNKTENVNIIERSKDILLNCLKEANSTSSTKLAKVKTEHVGKLVEMMSKKSLMLSMEFQIRQCLENNENIIEFLQMLFDTDSITQIDGDFQRSAGNFLFMPKF